MKDIWLRIEAWLQANAPAIANDLRPGAPEEEIRAAEQHFGVTFPDDYRQSLALHDGQGGDAPPLMGAWQLLPLKQSESQWDLMKDMLDAGDFADMEATSTGAVHPHWWSTKWIPVTYNGAGDLQCVDLEPAPGGSNGQIVEFRHESDRRAVLGQSFQDWLNSFALDLEAGRYRLEGKRLKRVGG